MIYKNIHFLLDNETLVMKSFSLVKQDKIDLKNISKLLYRTKKQRTFNLLM